MIVMVLIMITGLLVIDALGRMNFSTQNIKSSQNTSIQKLVC